MSAATIPASRSALSQLAARQLTPNRRPARTSQGRGFRRAARAPRRHQRDDGRPPPVACNRNVPALLTERLLVPAAPDCSPALSHRRQAGLGWPASSAVDRSHGRRWSSPPRLRDPSTRVRVCGDLQLRTPRRRYGSESDRRAPRCRRRSRVGRPDLGQFMMKITA